MRAWANSFSQLPYSFDFVNNPASNLTFGYTAVFSGSLIASCGAIATIIPPSITMIIYGVAAQESVPKLFLAGIVPGLLIGLLVAIYLMIYARIEMIPLTASLRWKNVWQSTGEAVWALFAPVVILGGIYGGIFTPTEAAGVACIYAVLVARFGPAVAAQLDAAIAVGGGVRWP